MTRKPEQQSEPKLRTAADVAPDLDEDLQAIAQQVRPDQYGRATAREFAIGKFSQHRRRRRYAES